VGASVTLMPVRMKGEHVRLLHRLWREDSGQDLVEYGLIVALVVIASIALFPQIATKMGAAFSSWGSNVQSIWIPWCPGSTTVQCP